MPDQALVSEARLWRAKAAVLRGSPMRILGIDPGSTATGFGVVDSAGGELAHVAHDTVTPPRNAPMAERLHLLYGAVRDAIARHRPDAAAVEQVFVAASPRAALVLGQARGAVLSAIAAGGTPVHEYSASQVKRAVTGNGRADKRQVQIMVRRLLGLDAPLASDAADALAAAICHAHTCRLGALGALGGARRRRPARGVAIRVGRPL